MCADPATQRTADITQVDEPPPRSERSGPFRIGELLGGTYEVTGLLGAGGMGVVYEAQDLPLNRPVAIKAPRMSIHADALRHEARALAALQHPNLVTVHAIGQHRGVEFMVMERVQGTSLDRRIAAAREAGELLPIDEVVSLLRQITDGLTAVHRAWISHRDLKPSNLVVSGKRVVLMDFGLVTPEFTIQHSMMRALAGSADYMAPEVIVGKVRPGGGPLVDLYALGVVAFELLSGRPPYATGSFKATLCKHVSADVPDTRATRPDVPDELAELVHELLAKDPEERPESSETVLWRLATLAGSTGPRPPHAPGTVLIVDDDAHVGAVLRASLARALPGIVVRSMDSPTDARERIEVDPPDIAVVDLNMPVVNGIEVCMHALSLPSAVRPHVVAMSAEASEADVDVLRALGVSAFVPKDERFVPELCRIVSELRHAPTRAVRVARRRA